MTGSFKIVKLQHIGDNYDGDLVTHYDVRVHEDILEGMPLDEIIRLSKVGLTALIDEATGYQDARSASALADMADDLVQKT